MRSKNQIKVDKILCFIRILEAKSVVPIGNVQILCYNEISHLSSILDFKEPSGAVVLGGEVNVSFMCDASSVGGSRSTFCYSECQQECVRVCAT